MEGSVYLKARQEWDERYADLVLGKRNWQITAAGMMAITLVLAFGMVWVSTRSKFVPYVVKSTSSATRSARRARSPRTPRESALTGWFATSSPLSCELLTI